MNEEELALCGPLKPQHNTTTTAKRRVLVIDDNVDGGELLAMLLTKLGCRTQVCSSGRQGLDVGASFEPEIVLLDLSMQEMDGHETCQRMRSTPWGTPARIYAYTGRAETSEYERARASGFDGYLLKPVCKTLLTDVVNGRLVTDWARHPEGLVRL